MSYPIYWMPSPKFSTGHPRKYIALVHHRMVGTLPGTDATFLRSDGRKASTNFGIGFCTKHSELLPVGDRQVCIHQYVKLGDQAWANGNWDASGRWDDLYPTTFINSRTVSIEHEDNGGSMDKLKRGIVKPQIIAASKWLDALLISGKTANMKAAGIKFTHGGAAEISDELASIPIDGKHIIDHHFISGRLKPYCWRPWSADKIGFPKADYVAYLRVDPEPPVDPEPLPDPEVVRLTAELAIANSKIRNATDALS